MPLRQGKLNDKLGIVKPDSSDSENTPSRSTNSSNWKHKPVRQAFDKNRPTDIDIVEHRHAESIDSHSQSDSDNSNNQIRLEPSQAVINAAHSSSDSDSNSTDSDSDSDHGESSSPSVIIPDEQPRCKPSSPVRPLSSPSKPRVPVASTSKLSQRDAPSQQQPSPATNESSSEDDKPIVSSVPQRRHKKNVFVDEEAEEESPPSSDFDDGPKIRPRSHLLRRSKAYVVQDTEQEEEEEEKEKENARSASNLGSSDRKAKLQALLDRKNKGKKRAAVADSSDDDSTSPPPSPPLKDKGKKRKLFVSPPPSPKAVKRQKKKPQALSSSSSSEDDFIVHDTSNEDSDRDIKSSNSKSNIKGKQRQIKSSPPVKKQARRLPSSQARGARSSPARKLTVKNFVPLSARKLTVKNFVPLSGRRSADEYSDDDIDDFVVPDDEEEFLGKPDKRSGSSSSNQTESESESEVEVRMSKTNTMAKRKGKARVQDSSEEEEELRVKDLPKKKKDKGKGNRKAKGEKKDKGKVKLKKRVIESDDEDLAREASSSEEQSEEDQEEDLEMSGLEDEQAQERQRRKKADRLKNARKHTYLGAEPETDSEEAEKSSGDDGEVDQAQDVERNIDSDLSDFIASDEGGEDNEVVEEFRQGLNAQAQGAKYYIKTYIVYLIHLIICPSVDWLLSDDNFLNASNYVERDINGLVSSLIGSTAWLERFKKSVDARPMFSIDLLAPDLTGAPCQACTMGRKRHSKFTGTTSGMRYDPKTFQDLVSDSDESDEDEDAAVGDFDLGEYCAGRAEVYHELKHWAWGAHRDVKALLADVLKTLPTKKKLPKSATKKEKKKERREFEDKLRAIADKQCEVLEGRGEISKLANMYIQATDQAKRDFTTS
ncbi:hypothetical protein T439DRAFT_378887 [Meredithblackwellia eburnea MCA 4105]